MPAHPWSPLSGNIRRPTFSHAGRARPIALIKARLKRAEQHYKENDVKGAMTDKIAVKRGSGNVFAEKPAAVSPRRPRVAA
jgi:hypothetical protein